MTGWRVGGEEDDRIERGAIIRGEREAAGGRNNGKEITAVNIAYAKPRWFFYLLWALLTMLCIPVAFYLDFAVLRVIILTVGEYITVGGVRHITEDFLGVFVFIPIAGILTGLLQYWLLRRYLPQMGWWVAATAAGWFLGVALATVPGLLHWTSPFSTLDAALFVMGFSIGLLQWLLLRRRVPRAGWWIAANIAGWGLLTLITVGNAF